jgi:hypothetical protein
VSRDTPPARSSAVPNTAVGTHFSSRLPDAKARLNGGTAAATSQTWADWLSTTVPISIVRSASCGASLLPCWPQQDLVDGQAARTTENEGDNLGDVFGGDLGLVVELLDALFGVGVGNVIWQLGGHDTWLAQRHADVWQRSCLSDSDQPLTPHLVAA